MQLRIIIVLLSWALTHPGPLSSQIIDKNIKIDNGRYDRLFIKNKEQWPAESRFFSKSPGLNIWLTDNGIVFDFYRITEYSTGQDALFHLTEKTVNSKERGRKGHIIKMNFDNSGKNRQEFNPGKPRDTYFHYYTGNDLTEWRQFVPGYDEVVGKSVFGENSGIDIRYYYDPQGFRYDFILQPGARIEDIAFSLEGTDSIWINNNGELVILTELGEIKHKGLKVFQRIEGERNEMAGKFLIRNDGSIGFNAAWHDPTKPLIIDPLVASTFLGGSEWEEATGIALNPEGKIYLTGSTASADFPTTPGAYDTTKNLGHDTFISVFSPDLSTLLYSTFLGGNDTDRSLDLVLNDEGIVYLTGWTNSADFPTTSGAFNETYNGTTDVFISALSPDLSELLYSTFLGGTLHEDASGIALDAEGNVYVTGGTHSNDFPTTEGAFDSTKTGIYVGFVSALSSDLSTLLYSTYLGGSGTDGGKSITVSHEGKVYAAGVAWSADFPTTEGAYNEEINGIGDCFVSILNSELSLLEYSTYLGGSSAEVCFDIKIDNNNNVLVTGGTPSADFPTTPGAYDTEFNGNNDLFVTLLKSDLSDLLYSTFLGGSDRDGGRSITISSAGDVYVTGFTESPQFPTTPGAFNEIFNGSRDLFVSVLNSELSQLLYSTFLGGSDDDQGNNIIIDEEGNVYLAGMTKSEDFPTTPGAYDIDFGGTADAFISIFEQLVVSIDKEEETGIPQSFIIFRNFPNPFNPSTTIRYGLPERSTVKLEIYNTIGQRVAVLANAELEAGYHEIEWYSKSVASGVYFYRIEAIPINNPANRFVQVRSMIVLK